MHFLRVKSFSSTLHLRLWDPDLGYRTLSCMSKQWKYACHISYHRKKQNKIPFIHFEKILQVLKNLIIANMNTRRKVFSTGLLYTELHPYNQELNLFGGTGMQIQSFANNFNSDRILHKQAKRDTSKILKIERKKKGKKKVYIWKQHFDFAPHFSPTLASRFYKARIYGWQKRSSQPASHQISRWTTRIRHSFSEVLNQKMSSCKKQ